MTENKYEHTSKASNVNALKNFDPSFTSPITNITVPVGREAILTCTVHDLVNFKVAWLRVDTQTILTIQNHVITKNTRIGITHTEKRIWQLRIRDVKEADRGWYMCQINTDPMKSQVGYLDVVVPPDILDYPTSQDIVVEEGQNVTLTCAATGSPEPIINWRREGGKPLFKGNNGMEVFNYEGAFLDIPFVTRYHMGAYLCIASNGVPPSKSKRIIIIVNFPPVISVKTRHVYAAMGERTMLECHSESNPNTVNYWMRHNKQDTKRIDFVLGGIYEPKLEDHIYRMVMKLPLTIHRASDYGSYKCVAKNSFGLSEEIIKVFPLQKTLNHVQLEIPVLERAFATNETSQQYLSDACENRNRKFFTLLLCLIYLRRFLIL
ncbi:neurotrimin-like [Culicoides brevitarsis]|uniref:neurotrimin-like n=1 Tax=Culicoides brevitarsis TaxID=469753 RepID=UPI00307BED15